MDEFKFKLLPIYLSECFEIPLIELFVLNVPNKSLTGIAARLNLIDH